ncbi:MAG: cation-translocating P-type ATPase [Verrucomicrobiota bacterium]
MNNSENAPDPKECRTCWLRITQREVELDHGDEHLGEWRWQLFAAGLCGLLGIAGALIPDPKWQLACNVLAYVSGAWFAAEETWEKLRERSVDVHFLMLAVAVGAAAIGQWSEGVVLLFLFAFAGALEHFALERTQREIRSLIQSAPKTATLVTSNGSELEVPVEQLHVGQVIRIKPGALFPVDGEVFSGETGADESTLTGEATPVEKGKGDPVLAGTLNLWGAVDLTVSREAAESALQKIITLIQGAQRQKAPSQRFTDRFGSGYTLGILGLTAVMFLFWWLVRGSAPFVSGEGVPSAFYKAMTLLVVASPCALVLSIPSAILAAIAAGAKRGILFRGGAAVEQLAQIQVVAMDKTGTLTTGELRVEAVESFPPGKERDIAELAFALERLSSHPLARAVTRYGKREGLRDRMLSGFHSVTGMGLEAEEGGKRIRLGRKSWVLEQWEGEGGVDEESAGVGVSEVWLVWGGVLGRLTLRDDVRAESGEVVRELHRRGLSSVVLTGDKKAAAEHLRALLGVQEIRAELKPEEKLAFINDLATRGHLAAMIGDGINDAPSLAAAHVGVAMGARGADAALEQADLVLMHDKLENFLTAYDLSVKARVVIMQNLTISLGVIVVLVAFALAGRIPLPLGVMGHEGSTLVVVLNSLRLLFFRTNLTVSVKRV